MSFYCFNESNCKFETMTKEEILAAIAQAAETGFVFDTDAAFISKVKERNAGGFVTFWVGTQAQYNALSSTDANCQYIITDKTESEFLPMKGGVMQGDIDMNGNALKGIKTPTEENEAAPKNYVDGLAAKAFPVKGGDMQGDVDMKGYALKGIKTPTEANEAAPKGYVDGLANVRNLLDNSDFTNPVNQRGKTSYGANVYTIDRWNTNANFGSVAIQSGYISLVGKSGLQSYFRQYIDWSKVLGKTVSFAVCSTNGTIKVATCTMPSTKPTADATYGSAVIDSNVAIYIGGRANYAMVQIRISNGATFNLKWAALYVGSFTIDTLPNYQPKGYGAELAEAMRYYQRGINNVVPAIAIGNNEAILTGLAKLPMRAMPTLTISVDWLRGGGTNLEGSHACTASVFSNNALTPVHKLTFEGNLGAYSWHTYMLHCSYELSADFV